MPRKTLLILLLLGPLSSGCVAVLVGATAAYGYVQYEENEAWRDYEAGFMTTWRATIDGLEELGYVVPRGTEPEPTEGRIETDDVLVKVERHPGNVTRVRVRVGTFDTADHRRRAGLILEEISSELP